MIEVMDSMSVMPGRGMYVESSYEIQFAEELLKKNILFIRPPSTEFIFYDLLKPTSQILFLLIRTTEDLPQSVKCLVIIEKIVEQQAENIGKNQTKKRKYYSTIRHKYNLLYWYAGDGDKMPDIYQPKSKK
jgi:hypothetical protein